MYNQTFEERETIVQQNMAEIQLAAEHFSADHGIDKFPSSLDENFLSYFPGGAENQSAAGASGFPNPFNGKIEFPIFVSADADTSNLKLPSVRSPADVQALRSADRFKLDRGSIIFFSLEGNKGYAIVGGAHDDLCLKDKLNAGQNLVLSNFE